MVACLGAYVDAHEGVCGGARRGFAARNKIRARTADGVLNGVGEKGCEH